MRKLILQAVGATLVAGGVLTATSTPLMAGGKWCAQNVNPNHRDGDATGPSCRGGIVPCEGSCTLTTRVVRDPNECRDSGNADQRCVRTMKDFSVLTYNGTCYRAETQNYPPEYGVWICGCTPQGDPAPVTQYTQLSTCTTIGG